MIARMHKTHVVARRQDRDRLLKALARLGVLHVAPVEPDKAVAETETVAALDRLGRAIQVLEATAPSTPAVDLPPREAADEVLRIQREAVERTNRLASLHRQVEQLALWGDVRLGQIEALRRAGVEPRFYAVPRQAVADVRAECVQPLAAWPGKKMLVAVVQRRGEAELPEGAEAVPLPSRDRPALRAEAAELDAALKADAERLARLAPLAPALAAERARLQDHAAWTIATRSALADDHLYALQGWVPEDQAATLAADLKAEGVESAVEAVEPGPQETPPTLLKYPAWARPMKGLFDVLGTVPGYREYDVSAVFMIALPIFSAIMISDAGYALAYLLLPLVFYRKMAAAGAGLLAKLVIVIGVLSLLWGLLTASFFGFDISVLMGIERAPVKVDTDKINMDLLMRVSFWLAAIHLSYAHLWLAKGHFPHPRFLGEVGWATFLWGMFGVVKMLLLGDPLFGTVFPWLLGVGASLAILFADPQRNVFKAVAIGLAKFPLAMIGTLGDTISYVRLMALGVAGSALAFSFNDIAQGLPWIAGILVLLVGHALNVALSVVSLLAHGVRLNVLEFSNNLGMQWSGYAYEPFSRTRGEET